MELKDRIALIIEENGFKQIQLAEQIGVSGSYISTLLSGRNRNVSMAVASLIEEKLGYCAEWVLSGEGPKRRMARRGSVLSDSQSKAIFKLERMSQKKVEAVLAFMDSLDRVGAALGEKSGPAYDKKSGELFAAFNDSGAVTAEEMELLKERKQRLEQRRKNNNA